MVVNVIYILNLSIVYTSSNHVFFNHVYIYSTMFILVQLQRFNPFVPKIIYIYIYIYIYVYIYICIYIYMYICIYICVGLENTCFYL